METRTFSHDMKTETDRTHIGPYNAWLENGALHVYGHSVGQGIGSNISMTPQETLRFFEWLSTNHELLSQMARMR